MRSTSGQAVSYCGLINFSADWDGMEMTTMLIPSLYHGCRLKLMWHIILVIVKADTVILREDVVDWIIVCQCSSVFEWL